MRFDKITKPSQDRLKTPVIASNFLALNTQSPSKKLPT